MPNHQFVSDFQNVTHLSWSLRGAVSAARTSAACSDGSSVGMVFCSGMAWMLAKCCSRASLSRCSCPAPPRCCLHTKMCTSHWVDLNRKSLPQKSAVICCVRLRHAPLAVLQLVAASTLVFAGSALTSSHELVATLLHFVHLASSL